MTGSQELHDPVSLGAGLRLVCDPCVVGGYDNDSFRNSGALRISDPAPDRGTRFLRFCAERYCAKGENRRNQQGKFADSGRDSEKNGIRRVSVHRQVQKCRVSSFGDT